MAPAEKILSQTSPQDLETVCEQFGVQELSIFGSALTQDIGPNSDLDLLVSFKPGSRVTFSTLARLQRELESRLNRKVDLVPKDGLKAAIRDSVLAAARILYAA